jgi:acetyl-CoA carboxylase biotin carboxyl carrier protein
MPGMEGELVEIEHLRELIRVLEDSSLSEIEIEEQGQRVLLRKPSAVAPSQTAFPVPVRTEVAPPPMLVPGAPSMQQTAPPAPQEEQAPQKNEGLVTIDAPMVGVFYRAPAPGDPPFVQPGDIVDKDQTVCIVEAMKLMNEVSAKYPAEIVKVLVENGEPVEFGQPLFTVRPLE